MRAGVRQWVLVVGVLVIAAGLRFYRLDAQSFWNDEGNSARIAERSLALITAGAAGDIHPPLYYYLLHVWRGVFGVSEFALRSLSAVLGVLLVWLTYLIARRAFSHEVGVVAAFIAAINPFQIVYSQEARMYLLLAVIGAAATGVLLSLLVKWSSSRVVQSSRASLIIDHCALIILYAAGLYTHYAFLFIIVAHFLIVLAWAIAQRRAVRQLMPWIGLAAAAGVLFIPWLPTAIRQITTWPSSRSTIDAGAMLLDTARWYILGPTFPTADALPAILISGLLLLLSLTPGPSPENEKQFSGEGSEPLPLSRNHLFDFGRGGRGVRLRGFDECRTEEAAPLPRSIRVGAIGVWWLAPIALIFSFGLFQESYLKFLLIGSAAFCILLARGLVTLRLGLTPDPSPENEKQFSGEGSGVRPSRNRGALNMAGQLRAIWSWTLVVAFLGAMLAVPTAQSLHNYYFDAKYARDDYRSIAQTILQHQRDGDAIILNSANQWEVFTYYYPDGPNVYPLPRQRPLDQAAVEAELIDLAQKYRRVFVLYWGETEADPDKVIETWLDAHTYKATEQWIGALRFVTYAIPARLSDRPQQRSAVRFGDHITLAGFTLPMQKLSPGDILQLDLFWRTDAKLTERYKVFVHVLDANGLIAAQTDREPGGGQNPTTNWPSNEWVIDRYGVLIPEDAAGGEYAIELGLYDFNNVRLPSASRGDAVVVAKIEVMSEK